MSTQHLSRAALLGAVILAPALASAQSPEPPTEPLAETPQLDPTTAPSQMEPNARGDYCPARLSPVNDDEVDRILREAALRAQVGQHGLAVDSHCRVLIAKKGDRLAILQAIRKSYAESGATQGLSSLLADLVVALLEASESMPDELGKRTKGLANTRLDELIAIDPTHPRIPELEARSRRTGGPRVSEDSSLFARLRGIFGMVVLLGIAFALSNNRRAVSWRVVGWGMGLQLIFALIILKSGPGRAVFEAAKVAIEKVLSFTDEGAGFIFGNLYRGTGEIGAEGPLSLVDGSTGDIVAVGTIFVMHVLPTIIFFGALMSVLFHLGVIQRFVHGVAWVMRRTMGTSGSESLSAAGNIFVGQTEAPLVVKPYLDKMTRSELMAVMCGGFATVAGGVLAAYARFGLDPGHLLSASVMSAPAALVVAKILYPEEEESETAGGAVHDPERLTSNVIDAAATGATDGLKLAANVGAMLVAFIGLIAMLNWIIAVGGSLFGAPDLALKDIFGAVFYPLSWCMGVDSQDLVNFGNLLGIKVSINEFVAFVELGALKGQMTERSFVIGTYALTGFANFSSIGIQIGGISAIAPSRRRDLAALGLKAMIGGAIASWLTACIAGVLI